MVAYTCTWVVYNMALAVTLQISVRKGEAGVQSLEKSDNSLEAFFFYEPKEL